MVEITQRRLATARRRAVAQRNYRRARDRALRKLSNKFPDEYRILLEEERERDYAEGKTWLDIDGTTNDSVSRARTTLTIVTGETKDTDSGDL